ncbi:sugar porter family MFS transporter [Phaeocystidibacter luteus]|uniref:Sugar porter family MFS transporter n=1 Tax=Phaeocystidibacter luteus TaxID=911197 RepID=A0A6N6RJJ4_9FLAO|nr:sugar porter family MFS transporter [Phaeocystidibacter luteus]KAB2807361.1 sugar porter family MFS transporter [Phaeocystidibacter luteus]
MKSEMKRGLMRIALIVALGGLLMGFDASVISGVNPFIVEEFDLTDFQLGWAVSSLTLVSAFAMLAAGPLSDRIGRRAVLRIAAVVYTISAIGSALAPDFNTLVIARMLGGIGVGASLILAPMYIAEIAPSEQRGKLVSFNQLNIVIGITLALVTNYLIVWLADQNLSWVSALGIDKYNWRWMLGLEAVPAVLYFLGLFLVPRSPRWLLMKGKDKEAEKIFSLFFESKHVREQIAEIQSSLETTTTKSHITDLLKPTLRFVLMVGLVIAVLQQITGINAVFFYAPMILEQTGVGRADSLLQAISIGVINLIFTVVAMRLIDKIGRRPLLIIGLSGLSASLFVLSFSFYQATYTFSGESYKGLEMPSELVLTTEVREYQSLGAFEEDAIAIFGEEWYEENSQTLQKQSIQLNAKVVLIAILGFIASFAVSLGPVMWVLFSELFPTQIRGLAIAAVGLVNGLVSFSVQLVFPWELANLGSSLTFLIFGIFAAFGLIFTLRVVPETKGKTLEEIEAEFVTN